MAASCFESMFYLVWYLPCLCTVIGGARFFNRLNEIQPKIFSLFLSSYMTTEHCEQSSGRTLYTLGDYNDCAIKQTKNILNLL